MSNMRNNEITSLRLYNPEHVLSPEKPSQKLLKDQNIINKKIVNDMQADRAIDELLKSVYVDKTQESVEQFYRETKEK